MEFNSHLAKLLFQKNNWILIAVIKKYHIRYLKIEKALIHYAEENV